MTIRTLTLDQPEKSNALSASAVEKLLDGVKAAHRDGTQTLVFAGLQAGLEQNLLARADTVGLASPGRRAFESEPAAVERLGRRHVADAERDV